MKLEHFHKAELIKLTSFLASKVILWDTIESTKTEIANFRSGLIDRATLQSLESVAKIPSSRQTSISVTYYLGAQIVLQSRDSGSWVLPTTDDSLNSPLLIQTISYLSSVLLNFHAKRKSLIKMTKPELPEDAKSYFQLDWGSEDFESLVATSFIVRDTNTPPECTETLNKLVALSDTFTTSTSTNPSD